ncbi:tyrosine-protein kinase Fyn [Platysternon megacephalum]|uniref:Tyrosine-protein kinase Fyn n=1 Tax=Platysternon megacephalum TaxID=55544 RepID=A0A4D9EYZ3_9SAUR|nr:tyrosine-protein kinase Fyn [Platysternon megacephalum]
MHRRFRQSHMGTRPRAHGLLHEELLKSKFLGLLHPWQEGFTDCTLVGDVGRPEQYSPGENECGQEAQFLKPGFRGIVPFGVPSGGKERKLHQVSMNWKLQPEAD